MMATNPHFAYDPDDSECTFDEPGDYEGYGLDTYRYLEAERESYILDPLTHAERGRLGGLATFAKYGREHMVAIARKGGEAYNIKYVATGLRAGRTNTP